MEREMTLPPEVVAELIATLEACAVFVDKQKFTPRAELQERIRKVLSEAKAE